MRDQCMGAGAIRLAALSLGLLAAGRPALATGAKAAAAPEVQGPTSFRIDPTCNAWRGARFPVLLWNGGEKPVPLNLRMGDLAGEPGGQPGNVRVALAAADGAAALPRAIAPAASAQLVVALEGVLGAGKWSAPLYNGPTQLTTLTFVVPDVPLRVKVDAADPNAPALTVTRGRGSVLVLRNEDSVGYDLDWEFTLGSRPAVLGGEPPRLVPPDAAPAPRKARVQIAAGGAATLLITPDERWFLESAGGPFFARVKDHVADALLTLTLHSDACKEGVAAPTKLLRVKTTLAYGGSPWDSYLVVGLVLVAGALCSLYITYKFPDEQVRTQLRHQLKEIAQGIEGLSMRLASLLRVLVGVEQRALAQRLAALRWYSTEFETKKTEIASGAARLARRVDLLQRMGRLRDAYELRGRTPPTVLERIESLFEDAGSHLDGLQATDADLQEAELKLSEIGKELSSLGQPDPRLEDHVVSSLERLHAELQQGGALSSSPTWTALAPLVPRLVEQLQANVPAKPLPPSEYYERDMLASRGSLLRSYVRLCDASAPLANDSPWVIRRDELVRLLRTDGAPALRCARRLVSEMSEQIYADDVRRAIAERRVGIRIDRHTLRVFEPAQLYLHFVDPTLELATARQEWSCTWNFGHVAPGATDDRRSYLEEDGWSVAHYFPGPGAYHLAVRFRHEKTGDLVDGGAKPVAVELDVVVAAQSEAGSWAGRKWRALANWAADRGAALARLALALGLAVIALVSGAKDQLLKMDVIPAMIAIFLMGFGSDQIKNLLSQKSKP